MPRWPGPAGADRGGDEVGAHPGGDERLGAVDDVAVAVAAAPWCAGRATSEPPPGSVIASDPIVSPARVGRTNRSTRSALPRRDDVRQRDAAGEQRRQQARGRPGLGERLGHRQRVEERPAGAAELLGDAEPEQPELAPPARAARAAPTRRPPTPAGAAPPRPARTPARVSISATCSAVQKPVTAAPPGCRRAASAATRRAPWPAGRTGWTRRRPRRAARGAARSRRPGWAARRPRPRGPRPRAAARGRGRAVRSPSSHATRSRPPAPRRATHSPRLASPPLSPERACTNVPERHPARSASRGDAGTRAPRAGDSAAGRLHGVGGSATTSGACRRRGTTCS